MATIDRDILICVARTSLRTKLAENVADRLTEIVVDAVLSINKGEHELLDLFMIEIIHMKHKLDSDTSLIKGLVLDHGSRHPDMPNRLNRCFILNCNISLEYDKSEVNSGFFYSNSEQMEKIAASEREFTDAKVRSIIEMKRKVCDMSEGFVVINQKGIDPVSLDMFAKEGILALRRAKRRNSERLQLSCGGYCVNSVEEISPECLGYAGTVFERTIGDEKYTFIQEVKNKYSVTILINGPTDHAIKQIKDAIRDGLHAVKNALDDKAVLQGGGAFEVAASLHLMNTTRKTADGKVKLGVESFSQALLCIPKILAENAGFDPQEVLISLQHEHENGSIVGLDINTGKPSDVSSIGVFENFCVKKQIILSAPVIASQLLLVDEIISAGTKFRCKTPKT